MSALLLRSFSVALVFGAILGAPATAAAQDPNFIPGASGVVRQTIPVSDATELVETKSSSGSTPTTLAADGFTPLDAAKLLTCPATTGSCRIEIDQNVVMAGGSTSTVFGICSKVDGVLITPCVNLGYAPPIRQTKNYVQFQSVAAGTHKVQTFVYTSRGGTAAAWGITYHIYK